MFHGKLRIHTCRVILLTSLVWFLIDVVILSFYSECLGGACKKSSEYEVEVPNALIAEQEEGNKLRSDEIKNVEKEDSSRYYKILIILKLLILQNTE